MGRRLLTTVVAVAAAACAVAPLVVPQASAAPAAASAPARSASSSAEAGLRHRLERDLGLGPGQRLVLRDIVPGEHSARHLRFDRTYRGLPVVGGDLVVHLDARDRVVGVDRASEADLSSLTSTAPTVRAAAARASAERMTGLPAAPEGSRLVVYALGSHARLAYETRTAAGPLDPHQQVTYTDADSGRRIRSWSTVPAAEGSGRSLYAGTVSLTTRRRNGAFELVDPSRGGQRVLDAHQVGAEKPPTGTVFTDRDNRWGSSRASDRQTAAVDAAYGAAMTWDFFASRLGRTGIRDDGVGARSFVHVGKSLDNAYWVDECFCMVYGDGGTSYRPVVSLDVAAHEMSHGVTASTARLVYVGESGALNEATSDMFAVAVEFAAHNASDPGDYLVGEEITRSAPFLRRLDRPSLDGNSSDCYYDGIGSGDTHAASGPANHFFFLLAEGSGSHRIGGIDYDSPTCDGSDLSGIGRAAATRIWYAALTRYFTSTTGYREAREATVRAARELYGNGSTQCRRVGRAWDAVGVPAGAATCAGQTPPIQANALRNGGFENGATGSWIATPGVIGREPDFFGPHTGAWYATFGGKGHANLTVASQAVKVPDVESPTLRFALAVFSLDGADSQHDTLTVTVTRDGTTHTLATYDNTDSSWTYLPQELSLDEYAGDRVVLSFVGLEDDSILTAFLLDDVLIPRPAT